jgi:hypothetical protein
MQLPAAATSFAVNAVANVALGKTGVKAGGRGSKKEHTAISVSLDAKQSPGTRLGAAMFVGRGEQLHVVGGGDNGNVDCFSRNVGTSGAGAPAAPDVWSATPIAGKPPSARRFFASSWSEGSADKGSVFITGGAAAGGAVFLDDVWELKYTATALRWVALPAMRKPFPRRCNHATAVSRGKLYMYGGCDAAGTMLPGLLVFDAAAKGWATVAVLGDDTDTRTALAPVCSAVSPTPISRMCHSMASASSGAIYVCGGSHHHRPLGDLWVIDPMPGGLTGVCQWRQVELPQGLMPPLAGASMTVLSATLNAAPAADAAGAKADDHGLKSPLAPQSNTTHSQLFLTAALRCAPSPEAPNPEACSASASSAIIIGVTHRRSDVYGDQYVGRIQAVDVGGGTDGPRSRASVLCRMGGKHVYAYGGIASGVKASANYSVGTLTVTHAQ